MSRNFTKILIDYLTNRKQALKIGDTISTFRTIYAGSPQGSVLSGILFILYVNGVFDLELHGKIQLYCDDIVLVYGKKQQDLLKETMIHDLSVLQDWFNNHFLMPNVDKLKYILFHGRERFQSFVERDLNILWNGKVVKRVPNAKYLGLIIDETLSFEPHLKSVRNKIVSMTYAIGRIRNFISDQVAKQLYFAYAFSHISYMNPLWSVASDTDQEILAVAQRKILRIVQKKDRFCHNNELFNSSFLPIEALNDYHLLVLAFKIKHNLIKNNVAIQFISDIHRYNTRQRNNFYVYSFETNFGKHDFYRRGLLAYNELNDYLKNIHTLNRFKRELKDFLLEKYNR
jgi:hypothetical protein